MYLIQYDGVIKLLLMSGHCVAFWQRTDI